MLAHNKIIPLIIWSFGFSDQVNCLLKKKNINNGLFVEFGAWDGVHLSNCKLLADNGWNGFFIEAEFNRYKSLLSNYQYKYHPIF